jgi:hypothetical protein
MEQDLDLTLVAMVGGGGLWLLSPSPKSVLGRHPTMTFPMIVSEKPSGQYIGLICDE